MGSCTWNVWQIYISAAHKGLFLRAGNIVQITQPNALFQTDWSPILGFSRVRKEPSTSISASKVRAHNKRYFLPYRSTKLVQTRRNYTQSVVIRPDWIIRTAWDRSSSSYPKYALFEVSILLLNRGYKHLLEKPRFSKNRRTQQQKLMLQRSVRGDKIKH